MQRANFVAVGSLFLALLAATGPGIAAPPAAAPTPPAQIGIDRTGMVLIEQGGKVVALGTVLHGDGRVVTALSRVSAQLPVFVRYASGNLEPARVGHADRERDLALLVPKTARSRQGIKAAHTARSPSMKALSAFGIGPNRSIVSAALSVKSETKIQGKSVLELDPAPKAAELGGPLLDREREAVAIVVSGCLGAPIGAPCTAAAVGLPLGEIRAFLRALPPAAELSIPWLGLQGMSADTGVVRGLRITQIEPGSPAAALGLRVGPDFATTDLLVAVAGEPVPTPDALKSALSRHASGERVELLIFGNGGYRVVSARLATPPAGQQAAAASTPAPGAKVRPSPSLAGPAGSKAK